MSLAKWVVVGVALLFCVRAEGQRFIQTVNTMADAVALNPRNVHTNVFVRGYYAAGDGGGGTFYFNQTVTSTNRGTRVAMSTAGWSLERLITDGDTISVKAFGAKVDGATADDVAFQNAIDWQTGTGQHWLEIPQGSMYLTGGVSTATGKIKLKGVGRRTSIITTDQPITLLSLSRTSGLSGDIQLRDFRLEGNRTATNGLTMQRVNYSDVSGIEIFEINGRGLVLDYVEDTFFKDVSVFHSGNYTNSLPAVALTNSQGICNSLTFARLHVERSWHDGLRDSSGSGIKYISPKFHGRLITDYSLSTLTNITGNGTTVTADFSAAHGLDTSDYVTISGTTNYNGSWLIASTPSATRLTLTITNTGGAETSATVQQNPQDVDLVRIDAGDRREFLGGQFAHFRRYGIRALTFANGTEGGVSVIGSDFSSGGNYIGTNGIGTALAAIRLESGTHTVDGNTFNEIESPHASVTNQVDIQLLAASAGVYGVNLHQEPDVSTYVENSSTKQRPSVIDSNGLFADPDYRYVPGVDNAGLAIRVDGDTNNRMDLDGNSLRFGGGSGNPDSVIYRDAANSIRIANGDNLKVEGLWNGGVFLLGSNYVWENAGDVYTKASAPASATDGTKLNSVPGTGTVTTMKEATVQVGDADIVTLDFGAGFDLTETPDTEIGVALDGSEVFTGGDLSWSGNVPTVAADSVALTTDTTGNYAAGDAEAGNALSGDSATAFFSAGTIEHERGGVEADVSAYSGLVGINAGATSEVDTEAELETHLGGLDVVAVSTDDITSANLATAVSDETGTGLVVFGTSPAITTPTLSLQDGNGAAPTTDGQIKYDRTTERLQVGDGAATQEFYPGDPAAAAMQRIAGSTFSTVQHMQDLFHSSGWTTGGTISSNSTTQVAVAAGTGFIRAVNNSTNILYYFDWAASTNTVSTNTTRFLGVEYNGGSPQVTDKATYDWDLRTEFPLGIVVNESGTLHIVNAPHAVGDHAGEMIQRSYQTMPLQRDVQAGGLILGETGTRNVTLSAGALWERLQRFSISAIDTSAADTFDSYLGATSDSTGNTQWDNANYNNSGVKTALTANRYCNHWFYVELDGDLLHLYGEAQHTTLAGALDESPPSTLPDRIKYTGRLVGRLVIQEGAATADEIQSSFTTTFSSSAATLHSDLGNLDYASAGHTGFQQGPLSGDVVTSGATATIQANSVALSTDTTGNYAAGDAEAGNALSGDSATAFFSAGTIEHERGGVEADVSAYSGLIGVNAGATSEVDTEAELETHLGSLNVIVSTEIDTAAELNALTTDTDMVLDTDIGATVQAYDADLDDLADGSLTGSKVQAATTTNSGVVELATAAETTTGTDATRAVTPDGLAGSNFGVSVVQIMVFDDSQDTGTGDGAGDIWFRVPSYLNGFNLVSVAACVQTAGTTGTLDVQIYNVTQAADMLSTKITIDSTETDSSTAATPAVIDGANDDVATADQLRIDVDAVHTTPAKGLLVELGFQLP